MRGEPRSRGEAIEERCVTDDDDNPIDENRLLLTAARSGNTGGAGSEAGEHAAAVPTVDWRHRRGDSVMPQLAIGVD